MFFYSKKTFDVTAPCDARSSIEIERLFFYTALSIQLLETRKLLLTLTTLDSLIDRSIRHRSIYRAISSTHPLSPHYHPLWPRVCVHKPF